jgi:hypothetical protein
MPVGHGVESAWIKGNALHLALDSAAGNGRIAPVLAG